MPVVLDGSWLGRRVVVRRAVNGGFGDVVGSLEAVDEEHATIRTRRGLTRVELGSISHARLVEPSTREILALEQVAAKGWQARDTRSEFGWLLRANEGFSSRANSVLALHDPTVTLDRALAASRAWYADRGLEAVIATPLPARRSLDEALDRLGWSVLGEVDLMVAPIAAISVRAPAQRAEAGPAAVLTLADEPDEHWLAAFQHHDAPSTTLARDLLTRHQRVRFAQIRLDGHIAAIGRGVVDDGWLGLSAIAVDEQVRRRGHAQALVAELAAWGARAGAQQVYLQVEQANVGAIALYDRLGFWRHHSYRYRKVP
jgi:ribosomal protein S18 acetylase RimI-like enzyme